MGDATTRVLRVLTGVTAPTTTTEPTTMPPELQPTFISDYHMVMIIGAVLSAFASMFFISRYLFCKKTRHHLTELIQFRCLFDFTYSVTLIAVAVEPNGICSHTVLWLQIFASASELYAFILSVDVILAIVDPFTNFNKRRWVYLVLVICVATGCGYLVWYEALTTHVGSSVSPLLGCDSANITTTALNSTNAEAWIGANAPAITLYLISFCNLVAALCWLSRGIRLSDALAARRNAIKAGIRYLAGYFVYWLLIRALFVHIKVAATFTAVGECVAERVCLMCLRAVMHRRSVLLSLLLSSSPIVVCCTHCSTVRGVLTAFYFVGATHTYNISQTSVPRCTDLVARSCDAILVALGHSTAAVLLWPAQDSDYLRPGWPGRHAHHPAAGVVVLRQARHHHLCEARAQAACS